MAKLLMISGDRALAAGRRGAFYNTLEAFHKYWERIDIITPPIFNFQLSFFNFLKPKTYNLKPITYFGNVFIHPSPWPLIFQPWWIFKRGAKIYREHKFDLVITHEYPPFYNGIGASMLWGKIKVPYVLEIMHIPGFPKAANFKERFYKLLIKLFIRFDASRAKAVRVINKKETPEFLKKAGVSDHKLLYIPAFYIDLDVFQPNEINKEYDLIFVGRLAENKGVDLFVEAAAKISGRSIIVGDGPLAEKLKAKSYKLRANVIFHGWGKDSQAVAQLLNRSKLLVMPSYNEGGPRVTLEAMACGVPVLATPVGIVPDLGPAVIRVDWNSEEIAKKASDVLNNKSEYIRLRQAGLEIVKQFEKKAAIKNYAVRLKKILLG